MYMDVSENSGTPKSSILIGFSIINHPFWGTSISGNTNIFMANHSSWIRRNLSYHRVGVLQTFLHGTCGGGVAKKRVILLTLTSNETIGKICCNHSKRQLKNKPSESTINPPPNPNSKMNTWFVRKCWLRVLHGRHLGKIPSGE